MVLNPGKCCFGSNPDKSDLILEDSTRLCRRLCNLGSYDRQQADVLQPPQKPLLKNCKKTKRADKNCPICESYLYTTHFLRDSLAIALLFGHFVRGVQIILSTNFKNEH